MEQEGAQAREQQGVGHIQPGQRGDQNCCAEHGEQMLHTQQQTLGDTQRVGIIHDFIVFGSCH